MAIVKYGPVIADARGSVGGTVFSRNAAGAYMKQRTVPTYPATGKQQARAALLSTLLHDWRNVLTPTQRATWNALASITSLPNNLGEMFTPSGLNLFIKANFMLDLTGQTHVTAAPIAAIAPAPTLTITHLAATGIEVTDIGNWDNSPTGLVIRQSFRNAPLTQNYFKGPYSVLNSLNFTAFDALPLLLAASASLVADTRTFYRFRAVLDTGAVSAPALYQVDVGDPT